MPAAAGGWIPAGTHAALPGPCVFTAQSVTTQAALSAATFAAPAAQRAPDLAGGTAARAATTQPSGSIQQGGEQADLPSPDEPGHVMQHGSSRKAAKTLLDNCDPSIHSPEQYRSSGPGPYQPPPP